MVLVELARAWLLDVNPMAKFGTAGTTWGRPRDGREGSNESSTHMLHGVLADGAHGVRPVNPT